MSLIFFFLLICGIILYLMGKRTISAIIFFFFLLKGFQIIPEVYFGLKPTDYAVLYVFFLFIWGCIKYDNFIPRNKLTICILLYLSFILFEMALSHYYYHIPWNEIIRTGRQHILILAYFVFRRLNRTEINYILNILFCIVLVQCCLFAIQVFTGLPLLAGNESNFKYGMIYRCYNVPMLICFYVFYGIFSNPFKKKNLKLITTLIPLITIFLPLHRSWSIIFIVILTFGFLLKFGMLKSLRNIIISSGVVSLLFITGSIYIGNRTMEDIDKVSQGEYVDAEDIELDQESTLLFRFAHFYERFVTTTETPIGSIFGLGFMAEGSAYTYNNFNFIIGLSDKITDEIIQVDTSDIAWSLLILRYGVLGTFLFLSFYIYLIIFYGKNYNDTLAISMMLYLIFILGLSITSDQLYYVNYLILPLIFYKFYYEKA